MATDPESTIRKSVTLPKKLWDAITEYRFSQRIGTEAEAIRRLLQRGLETEARRKPPSRPRRKGAS